MLNIRNCLAALCLVVTVTPVQARDYHYSDSHLHFVDFFQETDGMQQLVKAMDENMRIITLDLLPNDLPHFFISNLSALDSYEALRERLEVEVEYLKV